LGSAHPHAHANIEPSRLIGRFGRVGRLQRQTWRCFIANDGQASTGQIGEWCFARQTLMEGRPVSRWQRLSTARALHLIGARRLRRVGREWIWRFD
jgi:hypothetical protein